MGGQAGRATGTAERETGNDRQGRARRFRRRFRPRFRPRSRARRARFRRHGLIRPTSVCLTLVAVGAVICYLGLLLDERTLMAATVALIAMPVVSFACVLLQWFRGMPVAERTVTPQYERVDQYGRVVGCIVGDPPDERGLYRLHGVVVRWRSPFGLFVASRVETRSGETTVLPDDAGPASPDASRVAGKRVAGTARTEQMGSVRAYAPGDPIKLISWKHTARRGSLMTRETGRDERATLLLALNARGSSVASAGTGTSGAHDADSSAHVDAEVAALLPFLAAHARANAGGGDAGARIVVTDGVSFHEGAASARRFLAAVCAEAPSPSSAGGSGSGPGAGSGSGPGSGSDSSAGASAGRSSDAARAAAVSRYVQACGGPVSVVICDASHDKGLERALAATPVADRVHSVDPAHRPPERFTRTAVPGTPVPGTSAPVEGNAAPRVTGRRFRSVGRRPAESAASAESRHAEFRSVWSRLASHRFADTDAAIPAVVSTLTLLVTFGITLKGLSGLVATNGAWMWFAGVLLAVAAIESNIPWTAIAHRRDVRRHPDRREAVSGPRRGRRIRLELIRVGAYALLAAFVAAVLMVVRLRDLTGEWLFSKAQRGSAWRIVESAVIGGFDSLNLQLPPLKVSVAGDLFLILVVAAAAVLIRCLLIAKPTGPALTVLALAALAADYSIVGHTAPWWAIVALALAFPMGVWAVRPRDLKAQAALVASLVVMAVTVAGTPSAETLAYNVPLSIGEGGGMFSSDTVSPMIDLKRNITNGSDTVVLDYRSYKRMYLRMTTLDAFDGDTWGYDKDLALDAGLYGAGIQLGLDSSNEMDDSERDVVNPLSAYMRMLGYFGYDVAGVNQDTLEQFMGYAKVRIATLKSRFLPMPGIATDVNGVGSDWLGYQDGSIYNRSGSTSKDTVYTASGVYLDPIGSSSDFSELTAIEHTIDAFKQHNEAGARRMKRWFAERRALADSGLGEVDERADAVYIHATIGLDGVVRGPNDWELGKVSTYHMDLSGRDGSYGSSGSSGSSDDVSDFSGGTSEQDNPMVWGGSPTSGSGLVPSEITFNDTVTDQIGAGQDLIMYGFSSDGRSVVLAMPLTDLASADTSEWQGRDGIAYTGDDPTSAWTSMISDEMHSAMGMTNIHGVSSAGYNANPTLERIASAVKTSDRRAHVSRYTALPKTLPANVKAVIRRAQAAGIPIRGSGYDDQVRVMRWLVDYFTAKGNGFTYSLDAPDGDGRSNMEVVDDFLDPETGHAGYCQHYASALAVLARAMGVSSRIVLGYNAGADDDKDSDGYRQVKSRQLHAWVEAYLDGVGWVPFDVTPASEQNGTLADAASSGSSSADASASDSSADASSPRDTTTDASKTPGTSSDDSSADATDDTKTGKSDVKGSGASDASTSGGSVWSRSAAWFGALPLWGRVALGAAGVLPLLALLVLAPHGLRWWRRRRCIAVASAAAAAPDDVALRVRAWRAAWERVRREGRRRGVVWSPSDTDAAIAARIVATYASASPADVAPNRDTPGNASDDASGGVSETVMRVARNAVASAFGGVPDPVGRLPHDLRRLFRTPRHADGRRIGN